MGAQNGHIVPCLKSASLRKRMVMPSNETAKISKKRHSNIYRYVVNLIRKKERRERKREHIHLLEVLRKS